MTLMTMEDSVLVFLVFSHLQCSEYFRITLIKDLNAVSVLSPSASLLKEFSTRVVTVNSQCCILKYLNEL